MSGLTVGVWLGIAAGIFGGWFAGHWRLTRRAYKVTKATLPGMRKAARGWLVRTIFYGSAVAAGLVLLLFSTGHGR